MNRFVFIIPTNRAKWSMVSIRVVKRCSELEFWRRIRFEFLIFRLQFSNLCLKIKNKFLRLRQFFVERRILRLQRDVLALQLLQSRLMGR